MEPKQVREFRENYFKSREAMAKEFNMETRTIRAYENGENKSIPGIFVKAVELWLVTNYKNISDKDRDMYCSDHKIHGFVDRFVNFAITQGYSPDDLVTVLSLCRYKYENEIRLIVKGINDR